jgi:hypothetical protein
MRLTRYWIPCLLVSVVVAAAGCRSQDQAAADNTSGTLSPSAAKAAIGEVAIGHQLGADGTIAADQKGNNFSAGQPVFIAFTIGKAPAGTPVTVDWSGPNNQQLATDQKTVTRGQEGMSFASKDTTGWGPGDYHVDISVGGQKVDTERFSIKAPENAEGAGGTKPGDAISDVTVGHQLGADGSIAADQQGKNFVPGQPVFVALRSGSAPAGTVIEIDWFGPDNQKLGSDQKQVDPGQGVTHFATTSTGSWGLGDYHADLLVNGQKADTEHFSIVNAKKADKAGR